jgi:hypothetical protein
MTKEHVIGVVVGLATAALAINHSVPEFFTAHHAELLHETLSPGRFLPGHFMDKETSSGSAVFYTHARDGQLRQGF